MHKHMAGYFAKWVAEQAKPTSCSGIKLSPNFPHCCWSTVFFAAGEAVTCVYGISDITLHRHCKE